jgi:hypothetical protein
MSPLLPVGPVTQMQPDADITAAATTMLDRNLDWALMVLLWLLLGQRADPVTATRTHLIVPYSVSHANPMIPLNLSCCGAASLLRA